MIKRLTVYERRRFNSLISL